MASESNGTVDPGEVERFAALAEQWWDPAGKFRSLHKLNPVRLAFIRDEVCAAFGRDPRDAEPYAGLRMLDIGCGGGLLAEPLARLGAEVVGADPAVANIEVARIHAALAGLSIDYRPTTAEALADAGERFDVVLALEVVEHVADLDLFVARSAEMVKPGGLMVFATINRTLKAYALAIVGAEYILRWLPRGTHNWEKFVRPAELKAALAATGLVPAAETGVVYDPLADRLKPAADMDVNYMLAARRP
jgi:2-polyprenyl-6-hydroxyphenyl methylase/3-demethylubiquinone-9 3-methyltransferase